MASVGIVGGGPAGIVCGIWLTKLGIPNLVFEPAEIGGMQAASPFTNTWLGVVPPGTPARDVARNLAASAAHEDVAIVRERVEAISRSGSGFHVVTAQGGRDFDFLVLGTGSRVAAGGSERDGRTLIGLADLERLEGEQALGRIAILGGGDGAAEAHLMLSQRPHDGLRVFARTVRAREALWRRIPATDVRIGPYTVRDGHVLQDGDSFAFDRLVVCYGWESQLDRIAMDFALETEAKGYPLAGKFCETSIPNCFCIGELDAQMPDCVAYSIGSASVAAREIERRIMVARGWWAG